MKAFLYLGLTLALAASLPAEEGASTSKEMIAAVAAVEAKCDKARLTLAMTERRGTADGKEPLSEARKKVAAADPGTADGTLTYAPSGWLKDLNVPPSLRNPRPLRVRTAEGGGVLRNLMVSTSDGKEEAFGRVLRVPSTAPADAILTRRAGKVLAGITWSSEKAQGTELTLEGKRGEERHILVLSKDPFPHVRAWTLVRTLKSPEGRAFDQTYECIVRSGETPGLLEKVEEWVLVGGSGTTLSYRITEVKKTEPLPELKPEELGLRFPKGTYVTDARGEVPIEYQQTAEGVNEADIAETARLLAQGRVKPGQPAPVFELKDEKGKLTRLDQFRGDVVVLFWFATGSRPAQEAAPIIQLVHDRYRKKGTRVIGLWLADAGQMWAEADAFRKRYKWSFPLYEDPEGEAVLRYGLVPGVPKVAIVDRSGTLVYAEPGVDVEALVPILDKLTASK
jgi:peroxiredoxin